MPFILAFIFRTHFARSDLDIIKSFLISHLVIEFVSPSLKEFVLGMKDVDRSAVVFILWSNDMLGSTVPLHGSLHKRQAFRAISGGRAVHVAKNGPTISPQTDERIKRQSTSVHVRLVS